MITGYSCNQNVLASFARGSLDPERLELETTSLIAHELSFLRGRQKPVRSLASESAYYYVNSVQHKPNAREEKRPLDFFSVDFNEDFTAFHGQTLLDQAEYLNDAIRFTLSLYHTPGSVQRDSHLPDPTSVIIVGHSMGRVVARTMVTMPNYQANSINTTITLAAPHARPPVSFDGDIVRTFKGVNDYLGTGAKELAHVRLSNPDKKPVTASSHTQFSGLAIISRILILA
ncbi:PGAP1-like protein-domain-containing protein [Phaeosphaeriaceae sp. PMI808]|nr:PGAP1-like protein-domain-containing protein [Phaeosphaeriaceae sp. PMI808]